MGASSVRSRRSLRLKVRSSNTGYTIPKTNNTIDDLMSLCGRLTRSTTKKIKELNDFIICETYRCMPLLGDEKVHAPDWEEHVARYTVVLVKNK